ncbi:MAG: acyltransferase family protein [Sphingomonas sp.]|uniref:acyltransferase family protein n=1 Tax=Sphingomonas sp. TaxID=28214 RepID=UPI003F7E086A
MRGGRQIDNAELAPSPADGTKRRIYGIDLFRGALALLVILGHFAELTERHHFLTWFGYGFRMPLFIGLTGYLFNLGHARSISPTALLQKYYGRLILPWIAACAIALVITGSLEWISPIYTIVRPPYHLWFVPVMLSFMLTAQSCKLSPAMLLAAAIPLSIGAMYLFGVGHDVWQFGPWTPDRRYFIYPIYFALGVWVAQRGATTSRDYLLLMVALAGLLWWARLYQHPSTAAEAAAELLLCVPLIVLFPRLRGITFDIPLVRAIGRDSLFFYLWHPFAFALWATAGLSGVPLLVLAMVSMVIAWAAIGRVPLLSGVMGVRPTVPPTRVVPSTVAETAAAKRAI